MPLVRSLLALVLTLPAARATDWPQWLGPTRDGASPEAVQPWKEAPKVLWREAVGEGNSSPIVAGGRVFLHAKVAGKNEEEVITRDAASGKEVWRATYPRAAFTSLFGNGPRATPAVAGDRLFTLGITGLLTCWDAPTGRRLWQVDTLGQFKAKNLVFGVSCSPIVEGDLVLVNVGGPGASVVAFRAATGEAAWQTQDDPASYASPIAFTHGGRRQAVFLTGQAVIGLSPADGKLLWRHPFKDLLLESSTTPVRAGDTVLASSITLGSVGLGLKEAGGQPAVKEAWKIAALTSYFSTPVAVGAEHVYLVCGTNPLASRKPQANLHCVETATGKSLWSRPKVGAYHASLLRTGNNRLLMLEDYGQLVLVEPQASGYMELARAAVCGETWAHPALAGGRLYLRDNKEVMCLRLGE